MRAFLARLRPWAPTVLRLAIAFIFIHQGAHKVFRSLPDFVKSVTDMGFPRWMGYLAAWTELAGGVLVGLGFLTRLAALMLAGEMAVATFRSNIHNVFGLSFDLSAVCMCAALSLLLSGAGRLSLDRRFFGGGE